MPRQSKITNETIQKASKPRAYSIRIQFTIQIYIYIIYINGLSFFLPTVFRFFDDDTALLISGKILKSGQMFANFELAKVSY